MSDHSDVAPVAVRRYDAGSTLGFHHHSRASLSLLLAGSYEERIRDRTDAHLPGDLLFCPSGEAHAQHIDQQGARKLVISLDGPALEFLAEHCALDDAPFLRMPAAAFIGREIVSEIENSDSHSHVAIEAGILDLLGLFARLDTESRVSKGHWLWRVIECIEAEIDRPLSMSRLANAAGRHAATVTRQFRTVFGCSPADYQRNLRVSRAALLIRRGVPIAEAADRTGFADQAHLTRSFRRARGTTPGALHRR